MKKNRENLYARHEADKILSKRAVERITAKDSNFGEKAAAIAVVGAMKVKRKLGMGLKMTSYKVNIAGKKMKKKKNKKISLKNIINAVKSDAKQTGSIKATLKAARIAVKNAGGRKCIKLPRALPSHRNKIGGFLPAFLLPIFAGLSAAGALAGGVAGIAKTINESKVANRQLDEAKRHNLKMESIPIGKGLYLKPWGAGVKLHLNSKNI